MQTVRSQLFEGITNEECARMFQCFGAREAGYEAGALISEFDGEQNAVGVLLSGSADLVRLDADGNRTILETLEEGGVFGEVLAPARAATRFLWSAGGTAACSISTMIRSPSAAKTPACTTAFWCRTCSACSRPRRCA